MPGELTHEIGYIRQRLDELAEGQAEMRSDLRSISGNGQPGRLGVVEIKLGRCERKLERVYGYAMAFGSGAAIIVDVVWRVMVRR